MTQTYAELLRLADNNSRSAAQKVRKEKKPSFCNQLKFVVCFCSLRKNVENVKNSIEYQKNQKNLNQLIMQQFNRFLNEDGEKNNNKNKLVSLFLILLNISILLFI